MKLFYTRQLRARQNIEVDTHLCKMRDTLAVSFYSVDAHCSSDPASVGKHYIAGIGPEKKSTTHVCTGLGQRADLRKVSSHAEAVGLIELRALQEKKWPQLRFTLNPIPKHYHFYNNEENGYFFCRLLRETATPTINAAPAQQPNSH